MEALKSVNLKLQQGEFVAVMGASGSGKSTLLHILGGMERPSGGQIFVEGQEVNKLLFNEPMATEFRRERIGFVFQAFNLLSALTAEENVALPLILAGWNKQAITSAVEEMLHFVGLYERRKHRPSQLSGGQQQRVAIARALVRRPSLLLGDEPTGNLDMNTTMEVLKLFSIMRTELRQSVLLVTHDPVVAAHADRVILFQDGAVEQEWVHDHSMGIQERMTIIFERLHDVSGLGEGA